MLRSGSGTQPRPQPNIIAGSRTTAPACGEHHARNIPVILQKHFSPLKKLMQLAGHTGGHGEDKCSPTHQWESTAVHEQGVHLVEIHG